MNATVVARAHTRQLCCQRDTQRGSQLAPKRTVFFYKILSTHHINITNTNTITTNNWKQKDILSNTLINYYTKDFLSDTALGSMEVRR